MARSNEVCDHIALLLNPSETPPADKPQWTLLFCVSLPGSLVSSPPQWQRLESEPAGLVQEVLSEYVGNWGWRVTNEKEREVSGMIRVSSSIKQPLLQWSGQGGLFIKPLASEPQSPVTWLPRKEDEDPFDYRQRAIDHASMPATHQGLVRHCGGGSALCILIALQGVRGRCRSA